MAYTPAPEKQTYGTHRVPLVYSIDQRFTDNFSIDEGTINVIPQTNFNSDEKVVETRPNLAAFRVSNVAEIVRGVYAWEKTLGTVYYFVVTNNYVYSSTDGQTWTVVNTLASSANINPVGFTEHIDSSNTKVLFLAEGNEGFVFTTNAAGTKITDDDFPSPHLPFPVFIDGYIFLAKSATGDIYNCDLNVPTAWTAGSFISSEIYPDDLMALSKVDNYLLAIGRQGCEYFYDAANATASPLARQEGASLPFGTNVPYSIAANYNSVMLLANNNDGQQTFMLIQGLKYKEIKAPFLIRYLNYIRWNNTVWDTSLIRAYFLREAGKLLYGINTNVYGGSFKTYFYDFENEFWGEFSLKDDDDVSDTAYNFPVSFASPGTSLDLTNFVAGNWSNSISSKPFFAALGRCRFSGTTNGFTAYPVDELLLYSGGSASNLSLSKILVDIRTPNLTFDTINSKTMSRAGINAECEVPGDDSATISLYWSDDDYATYQGPRDLDLDSDIEFPFVTQLGKFRRRNFLVRVNLGQRVRFYWMEVDINKGQQ